MRPTAAGLLHCALAGLFAATSTSAQELEEICPGAEEGTGALWGAVTDSDAAMVLPGASVTAVWEVGGDEQQAQVEVGLDGGYTMCYVPMATELAVTASFATMTSGATTVTMSEIFTRQDLSLSMSGSASNDEDDDRIWACFFGGDSTINIQNSRIIRCDADWQPLEQCPKEELGAINVRGTGAGSGMVREAVEEMSREAKRLGANAVINLRESGDVATGGSIIGEAVRIDVNPINC